MQKICGKLDLSQIPDDRFQKGLVLRAAVVREGTVLGSSEIDTRKIRRGRVAFEVEFEAPFLPGAQRPCPVTLLVGPKLGDRELLAVDTLKHVVELQASADEKNVVEARASHLTIDLGRLIVDSKLYFCWLACCKEYTIRGRVVCRKWHYNSIEQTWVWCDEPVPGATVEAFDFDCWWWWCRSDLIKSAVTNIDGSFEITFNWCCLRLLPWPGPWVIDPDLRGRIEELLEVADLPLPQLPPGPDPDPTIFQEILGSASGLSGNVLSAAAELPTAALAPSAGPADAVSAEALLAVLPPSPELESLRVWPWWPGHDCAPDVFFRVTQPCDGETRVVYSENIFQTRFDIPTTLDVTLLANDQACCLPSCQDPECPECLKLSWIGCIPTDKISGTAGPPDLRGYSYTDTEKDQPFHGNLRVRGGVGWDVDYFRVEYSRDDGPWLELPVPAFSGFTRRYWDGSTNVPAPPPGFQPTLKSGKTVIVTRRHFEQLHGLPQFGGQVFWDDYDTLFYFNTLGDPALTPDGLYRLRFIGYSADAADNLDLSSERLLPTCGQQTAETVYIRVDNQQKNHAASTLAHPCGAPASLHKCLDEPDCSIDKICKNEGQADEECISPCDIVRLDPTDTLTIHFDVTVPANTKDGHLGGYWLRAEYGASLTVPLGTGSHGTFEADPPVAGVQVGPSYAQAISPAQGGVRPHWYGGSYKVVLLGSDFPVCCAYQLRLWAWKRTTNGCTNPSVTHWNQFTYSFTVLRPELCPDVCPPQQDEEA